MKAGNIDQRSTRYDIAEIHAGVGDLAEWIGQRYGVLVGSRRGKITPTECPQHRPGHTTSAYVTHWPDGGMTFRCERCDIGPVDVIDLLVGLGDAADRGQAIRMLGETSGARTDHQPPLMAKKRPERKPDPITPAEDSDQRPDPATAEAAKNGYLKRRRWSHDVWDHHRLEAVYRHGHVAIRHPFRVDGDVCGWQDRMPKAFNGPKWLSAKGRKVIPFNLDALKDPERGYLHIVEGPADAITLTEALFTGYPVIAAPGAGTWRPEWGRFAKGRTVIVTGDNDEAGAKFVGKVIESVTGHANWIGSVQPPDEHKDLSDWWLAEGQSAGDEITRQLEWVELSRRAAPDGVDR